eukprot:5422292-Prymnesium_polylepis.1
MVQPCMPARLRPGRHLHLQSPAPPVQALPRQRLHLQGRPPWPAAVASSASRRIAAQRNIDHNRKQTRGGRQESSGRRGQQRAEPHSATQRARTTQPRDCTPGLWCEGCRGVKPLRVSADHPEPCLPWFLNISQDLHGTVS